MAEIPTYLPTESFKFTKHPNPDWKFGEGIEKTDVGKEWMDGLKTGWKSIDPEQEDRRKLYGLLLSGIVPRPVAFVSSMSKDGVENLAPFSWFNQVSPWPPVISVSCGNKSNGLKDTAQNIRDTKGFTVNMISEPWIEHSNSCSIDAPSDISEWPLSGLTKEPSTHVKPARVRESAFSMECELLQAIDIIAPDTGVAATTLILGTVKLIHVRNDMFDARGVVDPGKLKPIARMGGITFAKISEGYQIPRTTWSESGEEIQSAL